MGGAGSDDCQKSLIVLLGEIFIYNYLCSMRSWVKIDSFVKVMEKVTFSCHRT